MAGDSLSILYFAWVRERIAMDGEVIDHPGASTSIASIIDQLARKSPGHAAALNDCARLRAAVDQHFVPIDAPVGNARELAIFPPVTGG